MEDTKSNEACQSSNLLLCSPAKETTGESSQSLLSPLKRQMSQITINPGGVAKKKLFTIVSNAVDQDTTPDSTL
ncbi:hypothetical protein Leryth_018658 [Lithospermum erythrorhizon]|nr:hypothetical protein Leryth_018658 [Lithospermum erythrorhizon]